MANVYRVDFHRWRYVSGLTKVTVRQKFGNHSLFLIDYAISSKQRHIIPPENTPFTIQLGTGPLGVQSLYGYVNHMEERVDDSGQRLARVVGIGTSKVMNSAAPTSWAGHTRSSIVRDIATRHRLRAVVHSHPEVLETWSSGAMTDFQVLKTLSDESGYRVWVDGSTVWFLDPVRALASASVRSTPLVRLNDPTSAEVLKGSNVPGQVKATKRVVQYGLDPTTNEVFKATSGDRRDPVEMLSGAVNTWTDAEFTTAATLRNRLDTAALKATLVGDSSVVPGAPVRFDGTGSPDRVGLWLVSEAEHEISSQGFTTTITATRDRDRPMNSKTPDILQREGVHNRAVIRNGRTWEAMVQEKVHA